MAKDRVLPDSPPWLFSNAANVAAADANFVAFAAANKVVLADTETGLCRFTIASENCKAKVMWVALTDGSVAYALGDGSVHILGIHNNDVYVQGKVSLKGEWFESMAFLSRDVLLVGGKSGKLYSVQGPASVRTVASVSEAISKLQTHSGVAAFGNRSVYLHTSASEEASLLYVHKRAIAALSLVTNTIGDFCLAIIDTAGTLLIHQKDAVSHTKKLPDEHCSPKMYAVAWIRDDLLVCGLPDGQLLVCHVAAEVTSHQFVNNLHSKAILSLLCVGGKVLSVGMDRRLTMWRVTETQSSQRSATPAERVYAEPAWSFLALGASVQGLALTADHSVLVSAGEPHLVKWNCDFSKQDGSVISSVSEEGLKALSICQFANSLLAVCTSEGSVVVFNLDSERVVSKTKLSDLQRVEWKSAEELLIVTSRALHSWKFLTSQLTSLHVLTEDCCAFQVVNDAYWFGSIRGNILAYSATHSRIYASTHHSSRVNFLLSNSETVAAASEDCTVSLHNPVGSYIATLAKHCRPVLALAWHPADKSLLASGSIDHSVQIWNVRTLTAVVNFRGHLGAVRYLAWSRAEFLVSGSDDQTVRVWEISAARGDVEPPILQVSRKADPSKVKSLFSNLHPLVYQQNRNEAVSACKNLIFEPTKTTPEHFLFNLDRDKALVLISNAKKAHDSVVLAFWERLQPPSPATALTSSDAPNIDLSWIDVAPLLGPEVWMRLCLARAQECLLERNTHKAALCFIAGGQAQSACDLYTASGLHIDALILAALLKLDLRVIYEQWAERLTSIGLHEQAFKCHVGSKNYLHAYESIGKSLSKDTGSIEALQEAVSRLA